MTEKLLLSLRYPKIDFEAVDELLDGAISERLKEEIKLCLEHIDDPINKSAYKPIEAENGLNIGL